MQRQHFGSGRGGRNDLHRAECAEVAQDRGLDPEVVGDNASAADTADTARSAGERHGVALRSGDSRDEVDPVSALLGHSGGTQCCLAGTHRAEGTGQCTRIADQAREPTCVDAGDAADPEAAQQTVERTLTPVVALAASHLTHDHTTTERTGRLEVGGIDAVVADVRVGESDDLTRVAGVGDHLLIPRQRRVEHDLATGDTTDGFGADQFTFEHTAVGQHQCGVTHDGHRRSPSRSQRLACSCTIVHEHAEGHTETGQPSRLSSRTGLTEPVSRSKPEDSGATRTSQRVSSHRPVSWPRHRCRDPAACPSGSALVA